MAGGAIAGSVTPFVSPKLSMTLGEDEELFSTPVVIGPRGSREGFPSEGRRGRDGGAAGRAAMTPGEVVGGGKESSIALAAVSLVSGEGTGPGTETGTAASASTASIACEGETETERVLFRYRYTKGVCIQV